MAVYVFEEKDHRRRNGSIQICRKFSKFVLLAENAISEFLIPAKVNSVKKLDFSLNNYPAKVKFAFGGLTARRASSTVCGIPGIPLNDCWFDCVSTLELPPQCVNRFSRLLYAVLHAAVFQITIPCIACRCDI